MSLGRRAAGYVNCMPNLLNTLTKPLQLGMRITFGLVQGIQHALGGQDEQPQEPQETPKPQAQREPAQRRNTRPKQLDDKTITDKVETELFRDANVAKGKIDVNTADGVVWLRGEAKTPEQIKELEAKARAIPEVKQVENLLHLPKTPAQKKTRRHKRAPAARKVAPSPVTSERKRTSADGAEPTPKELAKKREGRKPAPLGSAESGIEKVSSDDKTVKNDVAEPSPKDLAAKRQGRKAAPLGSNGKSS
jgi:hypothetical protein